MDEDFLLEVSDEEIFECKNMIREFLLQYMENGNIYIYFDLCKMFFDKCGNSDYLNEECNTFGEEEDGIKFFLDSLVYPEIN